MDGCRAYNFSDGRRLILREQRVLMLNAVLESDKRLFEVIIGPPDNLSDVVKNIAVFPITNSPTVECLPITNSTSRQCQTALDDLNLEARFSVISNPDLASEASVLETIDSYLRTTVCHE